MEKHEEDTLQKEQALQEVLENIDHADFGEAGANRSDDSTLEAAYLVDGGLQDEDDIQGEERQQEPSRPSDSSKETVQNSEAVMVQNDRVRHRSPPLEILCVAKNLSYLEKTAELFPSDSDLSSFGTCMMTQSRSSGSALNSPLRLSSLSRPSSMRSDSGSEHGSWMSDVQSSVRNWNSVVLSSLEQAKENSVRIKSIQKGTSKRAVRMKNLTFKIQERMDCMRDSQQKMCDELGSRLELLEQQFSKVTRWMDREAEYSTVKAYAAQPEIPAYFLPQSIAMTWVVPYADLVLSVQSIVSSKLQLPQVQGLQATLYLKGIGKGQGSHLSIGFRWVKTGKKQETTERYPVKITVQILNQADASETIEKRIVLVAFGEDESHSFKNDNLKNAIPKLIPISTVEDLSLGYQIDGRLLINITAEEVLCG